MGAGTIVERFGCDGQDIGLLAILACMCLSTEWPTLYRLASRQRIWSCLLILEKAADLMRGLIKSELCNLSVHIKIESDYS